MGVSPNTAIRAMTILEYSKNNQATGQAIKQARREIQQRARPTEKPKKLKANLNVLPEELRLQILRYAIPEEYHIETYDFNGNQTSLGENQKPSLPLLLVNRKVSDEAKTVHSSGVVISGSISTALEAVAAAGESKKRSIKLIKVTVTHSIDVLDRSFKDNMPDGWSEERKQRIEESVQRTAGEMCRRLDFLYDRRSVEDAQVLWFDKEVTRPGYWECITIKVDRYRRKSFLE